MKELLYKKSEAVAALNRVDGFHPMELARKIGEEGQEEQLYLDVKYRKLWFRLVNPAGKIISRIITFTENMAVVEARIYLDKCDQEDNYVANSFSQKFRSDDPKFGDKFLEMAENWIALLIPAVVTAAPAERIRSVSNLFLAFIVPPFLPCKDIRFAYV